MGFISDEKPYYDLGNNGYLPENVNHYDKTIENWKRYITDVLPPEHHEELVIIPTASSRINLIERAYDKDKLGNALLGDVIAPNFYDPNVLRTNLATGSSIVDFVLRNNITSHSHFSTKDTEFDKVLDKKITFVTDEMKSYRLLVTL